MTDDMTDVPGLDQLEVLRELEERAERGDGRVACYLGDRYRAGDSVPCLPEESFK